MSKNLDKLYQLLYADDGLLILLRLGEGLDLKKAEQIHDVLQKLSDEWRDKDSIPKQAVDIFIDFYPAMESAANHYSDIEAQKIIEVADKTMDLIRDCICN
jgi:hypothetical protein